MKRALFLLSILIFAYKVGQCQTNVSGGIYTNTTWTMANSPYIVVDTIVIFPGVTLNIQPGVIIKFNNNKRIEVRQAKIIAGGTSQDSIIFTSNSASPSPGNWSQIWINGGTLISKFNYCNFKYANTVFYNKSQNSFIANLEVKNSEFSQNITGVNCEGNNGGFSSIDSSTFSNNSKALEGSNIKVNSCKIINNQIGIRTHPYAGAFFYIKNSIINDNVIGITGVLAMEDGAAFYSVRNSTINSNTFAGIIEGQYASYVDTVANCEIMNNPIGILDSGSGGMLIKMCDIEHNNYGLKFKGSNKTLSCNKICNNNVYDVYYGVVSGSNLDMLNNDWCGRDSLSIITKIYDGYDNINFGLVNIFPLDSVSCFSPTKVLETVTKQNTSFKIYPNPFNESAFIELTHSNKQKFDLSIYDSQGQLVQTIDNIENGLAKIERKSLSNGIYFVRIITDRQNLMTGKFVIEQ